MNDNLRFANRNILRAIRSEHQMFDVGMSESSILENSLYYFLLSRGITSFLCYEYWAEKRLDIKKCVASKPMLDGQYRLFVGYVDDDGRAQNVPEGYEKDEVVSGFLGFSAFINKQEATSMVAIPKGDIQTKLAKVTLMLPLILAPLFDGKPLTDIEKAYLTSIRNTDGGVYRSELEKLFDIWEQKKNAIKLREFENRDKRVKFDKNNEIIRYAQRDIEDYMRNVDELQKKIASAIFDNECIQLAKDSDGIIQRFLDETPSIKLIDVADSSFTYQVRSKLTNYDIDVAKGLIKKCPGSNGSISCVYRDRYDANMMQERGKNEAYTTAITDDDLKLVLNAIFVKELYKINVLSTFTIDGACIRPGKKWVYTPNERENCIVNWHIQQYACLGNNESIILNALRNRDYPTAMIQTICVTSNINFLEPNTTTAFMRDILYDLDKKILTDGNNNPLSINEVLAELKATEATAEVKEDTNNG